MLLVALVVINTSSLAAEPVRITKDGKLKLAPVFINGGKEVVYSVHAEPKRVVLMKLDLDDGSPSMVLPDGRASQFDVSYSADGKYLAYAKSDTDRQLKLVILDIAQGIESVFAPPGTQRSTVRTPRFLSATKRVIFTLNGPGGQQIASVDLKAADLKGLTTSNGANAWPAVSPDGKQIVFSSSRAGAFNLYTMNVDGSDVKRLTDSPASDLHASWSPDGKRIAFTSARDGNYEVYVVNVDGGKLRRTTNHPERDDFPVWHPDGKRLLTIAERGGRFDLYFTDVDG